jgi:GxxExxY protein
MEAPSAGLKHEELTGKIIEVFYAVYNEVGFGFLESVYQKSMLIALRDAGLKAEPNVPITVWFRGQVVGEFFADIVVEDLVILELKSVRAIEPAHESQTLNYLRATQMEIGLLLNFGPKPEFRRLAFDNSRKKSRGSPLAPGSDSLPH